MILPYPTATLECRDWDPRAPEVASQLSGMIAAQAPGLSIEHFGSTAVPGCAGKGVIDLLVHYPPGQLEVGKRALHSLGFKPQGGRDPFPEDRPMRTGAIEYDGAIFRIHAHVVSSDSPEAAELLEFRDRLRRDPALLAAYVTNKRSILADGVTDALDYSVLKGSFIRAALANT